MLYLYTSNLLSKFRGIKFITFKLYFPTHFPRGGQSLLNLLTINQYQRPVCNLRMMSTLYEHLYFKKLSALSSVIGRYLVCKHSRKETIWRNEISSPTVCCITLTRKRSNCDTTAAVIMCHMKNLSFWAPSCRWKGSYKTVIDSMSVCQLTIFLKSGW